MLLFEIFEGYDVNKRDDDGDTLLIKAARHGDKGIIDLLLTDQRVNVNATCAKNKNAFTTSTTA